MKFFPHTLPGKLSVGLAIAMPILFFSGSWLVNLYPNTLAGNSILSDMQARPALALTMLAGMGAGVLAFMTGLLALIKHKDTAVAVYIATTFGGLLLVFLLGEIALPH